MVLLFAIVAPSLGWACTGFQLKAQDGSYVNGRSVEFGINLLLSAVVVPRNLELSGTLPNGQSGLKYKTKYAAVGGSTYGTTTIMDGLNEKGLTAAVFYFPDDATYSEITAENQKKALSPTEFNAWILSQFQTVEEVKVALNDVVIAPTTPKGWPSLPPFHYIVYDKSGKSIVIEPIDGKLNVYDNPLGVLTNSPRFDWQMTNLSNYANLSPYNVNELTLNKTIFKPFGQGSGMLGLPGDFTPPSRFVRAAFFSTNAIPSNNAQESVFQAFHILNQFDIPRGVVRSKANNKTDSEYTLATIVKDPQNLRYYFKTFEDQNIKMIDLNAFDLNADNVKFMSMQGQQTVEDISATATKKE